jgi:adenosylcobinamide kinase / adenosylcobinamide-phosphate guanylyltransferase
MPTDRPAIVTLVLGGVRSGKSHYAQQLGERADTVIFVATAQAFDDEMRSKIAIHQQSRPQQWLTVEEPLALAQVISEQGAKCDVMIVDCLTIFASNLLEATGEDRDLANRKVEDLCLALQSAQCDVVLVSNEVGSGVVPAYPLGRRFRDLLGEINQRVARVSDNVLLLVAGLPLVLKGKAESHS